MAVTGFEINLVLGLWFVCCMNYECVGESGQKVNLHEIGKNRLSLTVLIDSWFSVTSDWGSSVWFGSFVKYW